MNNIAFNEIRGSLRHWLIWYTLGWQDIIIKYRRSSLGPFWITLSMAVTIYTMGFLYGHLFKVDLARYFPYLASGIIGWTFISTLIIESSNAFIESENYLKNSESYCSIFIMRLVTRNLIIFAHNLLAFIPILFLFKTSLGFSVLLLFPGLFLLCINAVCWGTVLAILGARFRDLTQIITALVQVIFFMTPIMWMPSLLPQQYQWVTLFNPFNQFLNLLRNPLINQPVTSINLLTVLMLTLLGFVFFFFFTNKYKYRIVFWL